MTLRVGPVDTPSGKTYVYRIGTHHSEYTYANYQSALHAGKRPQRVNQCGRLEPREAGMTSDTDAG
jgi:hypothetical protein